MITLYHQDAGLKFTDITKAAGLTHKGWGMGVAVADFDNDGWQDIYVTGFASNPGVLPEIVGAKRQPPGPGVAFISAARSSPWPRWRPAAYTSRRGSCL